MNTFLYIVDCIFTNFNLFAVLQTIANQKPYYYIVKYKLLIIIAYYFKLFLWQRR